MNKVGGYRPVPPTSGVCRSGSSIVSSVSPRKLGTGRYHEKRPDPDYSWNGARGWDACSHPTGAWNSQRDRQIFFERSSKRAALRGGGGKQREGPRACNYIPSSEESRPMDALPVPEPSQAGGLLATSLGSPLSPSSVALLGFESGRLGKHSGTRSDLGEGC